MLRLETGRVANECRSRPCGAEEDESTVGAPLFGGEKERGAKSTTANTQKGGRCVPASQQTHSPFKAPGQGQPAGTSGDIGHHQRLGHDGLCHGPRKYHHGTDPMQRWGNEWRGSTCTAIHCQDQGEWPCYRPTRAGRGRTPTSHRNGAIGCRPAQSQWTAQANCICATAHLRCVGATVTLGAVVVGGWAAAPCT